MVTEISRDLLVDTIELAEIGNLKCENLRAILVSSDLLTTGNIPHTIILSDDGQLSTKITKEKVVLH